MSLRSARGRAWLSTVLDVLAPGISRWRALALYGDGLLAFRVGDMVGSRARSEAALALALRARDPEATGLAHLGVARIELEDGRGEEALVHGRAARDALAGVGERFGQAPLHMLAQASRLLGALGDAAAFFEESLALNRRLGDHPMVAIEHHNLGHVELSLGRVDAAAAHFDACEQLAPAGDDPYGKAMTAFNRASLACARGEMARARSLFDEARGLDVTLASDDAREFEALARKLRS